VRATLTIGEGGVMVETDLRLRDVTPGQSAVFYEGDQVLGGGIIQAEGR
jgi:tRNA-specific 2-thiouridylase